MATSRTIEDMLEDTTVTAFRMRDLFARILDQTDSRDIREIRPNVHAFTIGSVCMEVTRTDSVPREILSVKWHDHDWNGGDKVVSFE